MGATAEIAERPVDGDVPARAVSFGAPTLVAVALGVGELFWFVTQLLTGYFWQDDFVFLYLGATKAPGAELLLHDHNGHLQPGVFFISWVLARVAPLNYPAAIAVTAALHGLALLLCWRLLVRLFGERWAILIPFVVVAFSPLTFAMSMWWAYALQLLPVQLALFGALNAHAAYLARPTRWRAAQTLLFVALGLAFWEKAALIPAVLLGLTMTLAEGGIGRRVSTSIRRYWRLWLGHLALLAGYLVVHLLATDQQDAPRPGPADLVDLVGYMIGDRLLPALFGGPWNDSWVGFEGLGPPPVYVLVISWVLSAGVVLAGLWLGRLRAGFAFATLLGYLAMSVLLIGLSRLGPFGSLIGNDPRYIADALPVAVVFATVAVLRPRRQGDAPAPVLAAGSSPALATLGIVLVLVVGAVASISGAVPELRHEQARTYVTKLQQEYAAQPKLMLYDTPVPPDVLVALFGDHAYVSRVLRPLGIQVDQPTADLRMLDNEGRPWPVGLVEVIGTEPGPVPGCGHRIGGQTTSLRLTETVTGRRRVIRFGYFAGEWASAKVAVPGRQFEFDFQPGVHYVFMVADGPFDELLVSAEHPVCLTDVLVGSPLPDLNR